MGNPTIEDPELSADDRVALLRLARQAVEALVCGHVAPPVPPVPGASLKRGAFVSLFAYGALRGCIGHVASDRLLGEVVREMAVAAARDDPRFPPVTAEELSDLRLAVSVLTEPILVMPVDPRRIVIGRDGLLVRRGRAVGLLLPQVAPEYHWGPEAFLVATCRKAGLHPDAWRDPRTAVLTFQADVFGE